MIDWATLQAFSIPQGEVVKVESGSSVIWEKKNDEPTYNNLAQPNDTNTTWNGSWVNNARAGSNGRYRSSATSMATNTVEIKKGDVLYFDGTGFTKTGNGVTSGWNICFYKDSDATLPWYGGTPETISSTYAITFTYYPDGTLASMAFNINQRESAYVRLILANEKVVKSKVIITRDVIE